MGEFKEVVEITGDDSGLDRTLEHAGAKIKSSAASWSQSVAQLGRQLDATGKKMQSAGRSLTRYISLPIAAAGVASIYMAAKFNASFSKIEALAGKLGTSIEKAKEHVLELAKATGRSPQELAEGLYFVASAGLRASQVMPTLDASARAAAAGMGTTAEVAQTLTSVLNAYAGTGLNAAKAMDIMTMAVKRGKAETSDFATGLGPVIGVAAQAKISFADMTAAIAQATNLGVPFSRAVTGLRYVIQSLLSPTNIASEDLKGFGINAANLAGMIAKPGGLVKTLQFLAKNLLDGSAAGRKAWKDIIGGARGSIVAADLVGSHFDQAMGIVKATTRAGADSVDQFGNAVKTATDNDLFRFHKAIADLEVAAIRLGNRLLPLATKIAEKITGLVDAFERLPKETQDSILRFAAAAALLGPTLFMFGSLLRVGGGLLRIFGALGGTSRIIAGLGTAAAGAETGAAGLVGVLGGPVGLIALIGGITLASHGASTALNNLLNSLTGSKLRDIVDLLTNRNPGDESSSEYSSDQAKSRTRAVQQIGVFQSRTTQRMPYGPSPADIAMLNREIQAASGWGTDLGNVVRVWNSLTKAQREWLALNAPTKSLLLLMGSAAKVFKGDTAALRDYASVMANAHGVTEAQKTQIAGLIQKIHEHKGSLTAADRAAIEYYLSIGDMNDALGRLHRILSGLPKITTPKVILEGAERAIAQLRTLNAQLAAARAPVRIDIRTGQGHGGGIGGGYASGAVFATSGASFWRGNLIGEGRGPSFGGRGQGDELVLPLNGQGVDYLAKALGKALQRAGGARSGGSGPRTIHLSIPWEQIRRGVITIVDDEVGFRIGV